MPYVVKNKVTGKFYAHNGHYSKPYYLTDEISKAKIFKNKAGALLGLGSCKITEKFKGIRRIWKYSLPDHMELMEVTLSMKGGF